MLLLAVVVVGLAAGWAAHLLVGRGRPDYPRLFLVGLAGSLLGGLVGSLLFGDGLQLRLSGLVGSILGAVVVLLSLRALGVPEQRGK